jgi:hypothetical protein
VEFLVIMFFFGLAAGVVGRIKGGSFPIWFLVGFALPVLGLLAALLHRWESQELHRACEECGNVVAMHDQVCMRCGADLQFPSEVLAPRPAR